MFEFRIVPAGIEVPYYCKPITTVRHSETKDIWNLVVALRDDPRSVTGPVQAEPELQPGRVRHHDSGKEYHVIGVVLIAPYDRREERAVWYTALYPSPEDYGPDWVRPLHTDDGAGWLDPIDDVGTRRFERLSTNEIHLNYMDPTWLAGITARITAPD